MLLKIQEKYEGSVKILWKGGIFLLYTYVVVRFLRSSGNRFKWSQSMYKNFAGIVLFFFDR